MKHLVILTDGMADEPMPEQGGRTLLQLAHTPGMDRLARCGRNGRLLTIPTGFPAGSEVAHLSLLGYDLKQVYQGRAGFEALALGLRPAADELLLRCNLISVEQGRVVSHSAGGVGQEEAEVLVKHLQAALGNETLRFHIGKGYRHLISLKRGSGLLKSMPPHEALQSPIESLRLIPLAEEARYTADCLNRLAVAACSELSIHPMNESRRRRGLLPANGIALWDAGFCRGLEPLHTKFPTLGRGAMIAGTDLLKGMGRSMGLDVWSVEGATGGLDTNYRNKRLAALSALKTHDFVFLHMEACDEAGHEGNAEAKLRAIEAIDREVVSPLCEALMCPDAEPVAVALLPDHATPVARRVHTAEPIPFLIWYPKIEADEVEVFDEQAAHQGHYGLLEGDAFIRLFSTL